jgi:hypothetical protein
MDIPTPDILARGLFPRYFKGCDWPPFCEWQGEQIWQLLISRVRKLSPTGGVTVALGAQDAFWMKLCHHPKCSTLEGSKSNIPCCALLVRQVSATFVWYACYMTHIVYTRIVRVTFPWHMRQCHAGCARHIRESDANVPLKVEIVDEQFPLLQIDHISFDQWLI